MAANKELKADGRRSSLFSFSSKAPKVQLPPSPSPSRQSHSPRNQSPVGQKLSNSHLRHASSTQHLNLANPSSRSPFLIPPDGSGSIGPADSTLLLPPPLSELTPLRTSSPPGSRPGSRAGSRPGSRPASPARAFAPVDSPLRPLTPSTEAKQSKRRSWLPGFNRNESQENIEQPRAWICGAQENIPYDVSPLISAQNVRGHCFF